MNQNNRFCTQQGHECFEINKICTYRECDMKRWCCSQCLRFDFHKHQMPDSNHIMNQENFLNKVKQDIENLGKEYLQGKQRANLKSTGQQMGQEVKKIEVQVIDNQISDEEVNFELQQLAQKLEGINLKQLNDEDINELLHIDQNQLNYDDILQLQEFMNEEQNEKQYQENNQNKIIDFKSRQYDIQKIHKTITMFSIMASLISNNEKYLVYNVGNLLYIYDLKKNKSYKTITQKRELYSFQFTIDSKILFAADVEGYVYGYFVTNGFKRFYKQKIHQYEIKQLIVQKQYLITGSRDKTIIKTNFIKKHQIFKLIGHDYITRIDYDSLKDIMISLSDDHSLKLWDCKNKSILIEDNPGDLRDSYSYIQLINNKQDILKCDTYSLKIFAIDYQMKKLVQTYSHDFNLAQYLGQNLTFLLRTQQFQSINNDQNLLLTCTQYCMIFNMKGELLVLIEHGQDLNLASNTYIKCYRHQLDNLNYIILQDDEKICLLRVKDKN